MEKEPAQGPGGTRGPVGQDPRGGRSRGPWQHWNHAYMNAHFHLFLRRLGVQMLGNSQLVMGAPLPVPHTVAPQTLRSQRPLPTAGTTEGSSGMALMEWLERPRFLRTGPALPCP